MTNIKDQLNETEKLKKENHKLHLKTLQQKEIIRLQYEIIENYKELTDVISGEWKVVS